MRIVSGIALLAAALVAAPRAAQAQSGPRLEVTPIVGATLFLDDGPNTFALSRGTKDPLIVQGGRYSNALTLGVNAGVRWNDRFAIEGLFSWLPTKLTAENLPESTDVDA